MNLYLDCEFNGFEGDLISIALVSDDGKEFYEAIACSNPIPWVAENVIPKIGKTELVTRPLVTKRLSGFLSQFKKITIIADWPSDFKHFLDCLILGPGMMISIPKMEMHMVSIRVESENKHNALSDARALRCAYLNGAKL